MDDRNIQEPLIQEDSPLRRETGEARKGGIPEIVFYLLSAIFAILAIVFSVVPELNPYYAAHDLIFLPNEKCTQFKGGYIFSCLVAKVLGWVAKTGSFKLLFPFFVSVFHFFYDDLESTHISYIFREDKYGVVLYFILLSSFDLVYRTSQFILAGLQRCFQNDIDCSLALFVAIEEVWRPIVLSLLKMGCFNAIFQNHTSVWPEKEENAAKGKVKFHRVIHIICVGLAGLFAILARSLFMTSNEEGVDFELYSGGKVVSTWVQMLVCIAGFGAAYKLCAHVAENRCDVMGTKKKIFNVLSVIFEALLIVTIM